MYNSKAWGKLRNRKNEAIDLSAETKKETEKNIKDGTYTLTNLN